MNLICKWIGHKPVKEWRWDTSACVSSKLWVRHCIRCHEVYDSIISPVKPRDMLSELTIYGTFVDYRNHAEVETPLVKPTLQKPLCVSISQARVPTEAEKVYIDQHVSKAKEMDEEIILTLETIRVELRKRRETNQSPSFGTILKLEDLIRKLKDAPNAK